MAIATSAQLARALYDNTAESPQELSFRRGDVLRVLQREGAGGLDGWCLCSLHGQQGIVPANRVKLLPAGPAPQPGSPSPAPEHSNEDQEVYVVPPPARPCPTVGPQAGPCLPSPDPIYKVPRGSGTQTAAPGDALEVYDVPPTALRVPSNGPYDSPASFSRPLAQGALQPPGEDEAPYDVPLAPKLPSELEADLEWEGGREPEPPLYAAPSNLKRASALLNLYEAPEELLADGEGGGTDEGIYDVPLLGPEAPPSPEPPGASASNDLDALALLLARSPPLPHRPRLPSAESLSRRPLPALPVPEAPSPSPAPSPAPGRKGSIQDRPLPPPPPRLPGYGGPKVEEDPEGREVEDDPAGPHNEYEGIPMAEEYDYVHLKGMDKAQGCRPLDKACPGDPELLERGLPEQQACPSTTALAIRRPHARRSHWICPLETCSSCTSMQASARATTQPCRLPWRPSHPAPRPTSPHASSCPTANGWWWLLTVWCLLGTLWAGWQPPLLCEPRLGLQGQHWARHCGPPSWLSKGLPWATRPTLRPKRWRSVWRHWQGRPCSSPLCSPAWPPEPPSALFCLSSACQSPLLGVGLPPEGSVLRTRRGVGIFPFLVISVSHRDVPTPPTAFCMSHFV
ncbi:embryonal Fyn-associated substrate isoform X2 [Mustela putorius furo]|uniref:Embryonal Fyn-associated substrate isoform X2 n=1 Tax=Mustela putorius furo TaxID=9669 RepID=A0A8U0RI03_MUSPF|nr:embryonal Fyn-associated substrate isoform X2 [Mustela putorius furo]